MSNTEATSRPVRWDATEFAVLVPHCESELNAALEQISAARLVAYPTETVWGLGCDARRGDALARLRAWKRRSAGVPISVLVDAPDALAEIGCQTNAVSRRLAAALWPGPLTLLLRCEDAALAGVVGRGGSLGVRCSSHRAARALATAAREAGLGPLTSTSLNASGAPPARTCSEARAICDAGDDLGGRRPLVFQPQGLAEAGAGVASTIVDLTGEKPRLLRAGALSLPELEAVAGAHFAAPPPRT